MDLMGIANELNCKHFLNTLNIEGVYIVNKSESHYPHGKTNCYYLGNRESGKIFFITERYRTFNEGQIRFLIFHEMAHQLVGDHGPDFKLVMKQYTGASQAETLEFAKILKMNIEHKEANGKLHNRSMLPPEAQAGFHKKEQDRKQRIIKKSHDKKREEIFDILRILTGTAGFIGLFCGLSLTVLGIFGFGPDNPHNWYWIISMIAIPACYFKLAG